MGKRQRDCACCGAAVGIIGRDLCCRCILRAQRAAAKARCPGCGKDRALDTSTGRCVVCSHVCVDCGAVVRRTDRDRCTTCHRRHELAAAKRPCPRCGRPGLLRPATGWCGTCSRPSPPRKPAQACVVCGKVRRHAALGMCSACWQRHPDRPFARAERLAARLQDPPDWLGDLVVFLAARHCVGRTSVMITELGRLLADGGAVHPQTLMERSRRPGRSMGTLARALQDFFVARGAAVPLDQDERLAAGRRQRRLDGTPEPLRAAVARFADHCLAERERARRAGTRPRQLGTIEAHLRIVRNLGVFLVQQRHVQDWAAVTSYDLEAFLAHHPTQRKSALAASRKFFAWARSQRLILIDPARGMTAREPRGFRGKTLTLAQQRTLFRRWSIHQVSHNESTPNNPTANDPTNEDPVAAATPHPHEALIGLLCLLHGASSAELRALTVDDIDARAQTVQFAGRPLPTPLDPTSWAALQRCLAHRQALRTANPHVLVTRGTKATRVAASGPYVTHVLDAVDVAPRTLRQTRLLHLASGLDPKLVATAFGMRPEGVLPYLADRIDPTRLTPTPPPHKP